MASSSSRRTKPDSSRDTSSTSTEVTVLTESFRAQRYTIPMAQHTHQTAPTQFVNAAGVRFAYRRFGESGGVPLVFNMHFTGTMDHWDPLVTDGLAATRGGVLFNTAGI